LSPYTRFGFSPHAIFTVSGAPGNRIAREPRVGTGRTTTPRPPMRLADPGSSCRAVIPPCTARWNPGSWGQAECSAHTPGVVGAVASLPSEWAFAHGDGYTPRWLWVSMRPGVTTCPVTSMTRIPSVFGGLPAPTARMRPPATAT
jgi:hypothetical protein